MPPIRLILADDHPIILDGVAHLLGNSQEFEVVGRYGNGDAALEGVRTLHPDIAILDMRMPSRSGLEVLRQIQLEMLATRVVLLTAELTDDETLEAVRIGVSGIILKETAGQLLPQALRTVAAGGKAIDDSAIRKALDRMLRREAGEAEVNRVLTPREIQIVRLVATGLRNKEIATSLSISESTVKIHVHAIYTKLGISGRVDLANYAREKLLI
jgi:DNA-binding NarL/FixJ family response regulator